MNKKITIIIVLLIPVAFILGNKLPLLESKNIKQQSVKSEKNTIEDLTQTVLPEKGMNLKVTLNEVVLKMVKSGTIDKEKFEKLYGERGGIPSEFASIFEKSYTDPLSINTANANFLLNVFWPLGIANKTRTLDENPMGA